MIGPTAVLGAVQRATAARAMIAPFFTPHGYLLYAQRQTSPGAQQVPLEFPSSLLDGLDLAVFDGLCRSVDDHLDHATKYGDLHFRMGKAWRDARQLGLHRSQPLDVLDIGTGPGFFPYVCQRLGHRCVGLDQPGDFVFWKALHGWLGIGEIIEYEIKSLEPMPPIGRFDLVTAYRAQFHFNPAEDRLWNLAEWRFFLDDVRDHLLKPYGRLALKLNPQDHNRGRSMSGQGNGGLSRDVLLTRLADRGASPFGKGLLFAPIRPAC